MRTIDASTRHNALLGHSGENEAVQVRFRLSEFIKTFPNGTASLLLKRPGDTSAYPVVLDVDGEYAYWTVTNGDCEKPGYIHCELQWKVNTTLVKSDIFTFYIPEGLKCGDEPPSPPGKSWFEKLEGEIGDLNDLSTDNKDNLVSAINEAASKGGGKKDWSQNDQNAEDYIMNRPGAYMTDPVVTEIYNGTLPEMAQIQMDYVPNVGDTVTIKVGSESIDCTVSIYEESGIPYFATAPLEEILGGSVANCVICVYQQSAWIMQTGGTYTGQNAVFEAAIRQAVKIPEKFLDLENVKDVVWIKFTYDSKFKMYFSENLDGTYAEYKDIVAALQSGKLVAAMASVFGEAVNVGLVDGYGKYVNDLSASFYEVRNGSSALMSLAYFRWKSGHIWEKIDGSIAFSHDKPMPSTLEGEQGTKSSVAKSDHSHPDRTSIQFLGKLTDGDEKTVECGNVSPDTPFMVSGLDIPIGAEITLGFDDFTPDTPITMTWGGTATVDFPNSGKFWRVNLAYNACTDAYTVTTTRALTNLKLTYKTVPEQTKDYQKYVLAPYTVAPHLLLASANGLHKLTVDDDGNVLVDGKKIASPTETT